MSLARFPIFFLLSQQEAGAFQPNKAQKTATKNPDNKLTLSTGLSHIKSAVQQAPQTVFDPSLHGCSYGAFTPGCVPDDEFCYMDPATAASGMLGDDSQHTALQCSPKLKENDECGFYDRRYWNHVCGESESGARLSCQPVDQVIEKFAKELGAGDATPPLPGVEYTEADHPKGNFFGDVPAKCQPCCETNWDCSHFENKVPKCPKISLEEREWATYKVVLPSTTQVCATPHSITDSDIFPEDKRAEIPWPINDDTQFFVECPPGSPAGQWAPVSSGFSACTSLSEFSQMAAAHGDHVFARAGEGYDIPGAMVGEIRDTMQFAAVAKVGVCDQAPPKPAPRPKAQAVPRKSAVAPRPKAMPKPVAKPVAKPAPKPVAKPAAQPAPKPVAKPPAPKPVAKPAAPKPVAKPAAAKPVAPQPISKPAPKSPAGERPPASNEREGEKEERKPKAADENFPEEDGKKKWSEEQAKKSDDSNKSEDSESKEEDKSEVQKMVEENNQEALEKSDTKGDEVAVAAPEKEEKLEEVTEKKDERPAGTQKRSEEEDKPREHPPPLKEAAALYNKKAELKFANHKDFPSQPSAAPAKVTFVNNQATANVAKHVANGKAVSDQLKKISAWRFEAMERQRQAANEARRAQAVRSYQNRMSPHIAGMFDTFANTINFQAQRQQMQQGLMNPNMPEKRGKNFFNGQELSS